MAHIIYLQGTGGGKGGGGGSSAVLVPLTVTQNGTFDPVNYNADGFSSVAVSVATGGTSDLDGLVDGTIVTFAMPAGKSRIWKRRFDGMTSLLTADLGGATQIDENAFYNCTNLASLNLGGTLVTVGQYAFYGCTRVADLATIPTSITSIGTYAFYNVGTTGGSHWVLAPANACSVGSYAFQNSKIGKVKGRYSSIGTYAFQGCSHLDEVDIAAATSIGDYAFQNDTALTKTRAVVNGSLGQYAFYGCYNVNDCDFSGARITSVGQYAFSRFGGNRSTPSSNILDIDLRNSTFTAINAYSFGGDNSSTMYKNNYMRYFFPATLTSIAGGNNFRYNDNCEYYFASSAPPTLTTATAWANATNYKIFAPYQNVDAYRNATNWSAQSAYLYGYAPANTFADNDTLPTVNGEGYGLTWYSDSSMTTQVTTVTDATQIYYCAVGTVRLVYEITSITALDCSITITDGTNTYVQGDQVALNTVLTITATPSVAGYTPYIFTVNGNAFTSGDTITVTENIAITAIYWDGENVPVNPVFGDNSWDIIKTACRNGLAQTIGWAVGDTKSVTLTNGNTMTVRIADLKAGRYALADGSGYSNIVIEFVEQFANTSYMNSSNTNAGGWANSYMRNTTMPACLALLPQDMQDAISEVNVLSGTGSSTISGTSSSANKLFLLSEWAAFGARTYSIGSAEEPEGQYGYYSANNTNAARIKQRADSNAAWWLRSPLGYSSYFCGVGSDGSAGYNSAGRSNGVSPCFAI